MADKCDAVLGGNQCGFDAEWAVEDLATGDMYFACMKDVGVVAEQHEITHGDIQRL